MVASGRTLGRGAVDEAGRTNPMEERGGRGRVGKIPRR